MTSALTTPASARQEFEDRYTTIRGIRLRYWQTGERGPAVLLLHGLNGCVEHWRPTVAGLSAGHRVWALDGPGHGLSEPDERSYDPMFMRDLVAEFLRSQGLERASVVALSGSGLVAIPLALDCPQLVDRLVLVDSAGLGRGISLRLRALAASPMPADSAFENRWSREQLRFWVSMAFFADPRRLTEETLDDLYANICRPHTMRTAARLMRWGVRWWGQRYAFDRQLRRIAAPTLIIWGKQDRLLPVAHAYGAARKIRKARLVVFDPCGHLPMLEQPDKFNRAVQDFLAGGVS